MCQRPCYCICWFYTPLLEYAVPVWHPGLTEKQHYALELIQRRACRLKLGYTYSHYKEALITCNIPELKLHRDKICLDFAKKLYISTEFRKWLPKLRSEATGRTLRNAQKNDHSKVTYKQVHVPSKPYLIHDSFM